MVKKYIYEATWLLRFNLLISRKYKHFSDCTESCIESHSLHAPEMFSSVPTAKQEGESPQLLTKHSILVIAEFELYYIYTYMCTSLYISELFLIHENHSEINMDYRLCLFKNRRLLLQLQMYLTHLFELHVYFNYTLPNWSTWS